MSGVLKLGLLGLGEAATEILPAYINSPRIKITAAADTRESSLKLVQQELEAKVYHSVEDLCQCSDVDVVYIATPHELHAQHALVALENRKHVVVEKPMALTVEDCERMNAAAEKYGVKLLCGHSHGYDSPIRKMREIIRSGELGDLCMIQTWNFNDFMVRPYPDHALRMSRGVVLNQGPHQVDLVRVLGGGKVRSVRAMAGRWDLTRPGEGGYSCYLEFEDGVSATLVFNGYGFFDTAELFWWIGEGGQARYPEKNMRARQNYNRLKETDGSERERVLDEMKEKMRYGSVKVGERPEMPDGWEKGGGRGGPESQTRHQQFFGLTVVTCTKGDMRQSPDGVFIYGNEKKEVPLEPGVRGREAEIEELYNGVVLGKPMLHDGRWGEATLEVCLGILQSSEQRKEIYMSHQVSERD